jgi:hypothetical protein
MTADTYLLHAPSKSSTPAAGTSLTVSLALVAIAVMIVVASWAIADPSNIILTFDGVGP